MSHDAKMAEGQENDNNGERNHENVNGIDLSGMSLGLGNGQSSLQNIVNACTQGKLVVSLLIIAIIQS